MSTVSRRGLVGMIQALWLYRKFVFSMVGREFRGRYFGSLLGVFWAVLTPLATILIYLVIFAAVLGAKLPGGRGDTLSYGLFLCTGILSWTYFLETVSKCQTVFLEYANLLKKMSFPRITLPVIVLLSATLNFALIAALFLGILLILGRFPGPAILGFLPLLLIQQGLAIGLGILLGTLHVFFRDIGQIWTVVVNLWFWVTPIVYDIEIVKSDLAQRLIGLNPLTALFLSYQRIVIHGSWPTWQDLEYPLITALLLLTVGLFTFRRLSPEMVDEL